ncbi:MAG: hypothetical protein K0Q59_3941 [Paenibacillus sp.]|nr:hypothetical protein [Paenibacillus sp.]
MFANWKSAVYEYAHCRNQLEVDGETGKLGAIVRDGRFVRRLDDRIRRVQASRKARRAEPLRCETGLKVRNVEESDQGATIWLESRRSTEYGQSGHTYREERVEQEKITLLQQDGRWAIAGVKPVVTERLPSLTPTPLFIHEETEPTRESARSRSSAPYLNTRVLSGFQPPSLPRGRPYDRAKAQHYAETWWNKANPAYLHFEVDCTNFVSQCLFAGGAPMNYTGKRESGWWYEGQDGSRELWSYSWAVAHSLQSYLTASKGGLHAELVQAPELLSIGDVVCYDWDGDGRFQHNAIVTGFDAASMPLVNAHTTDSRMRYWDYRDSYAWTPNTRYRFFHLADYF